MPSYEQIGSKICPKCKTETKNKKCPSCGSATRGNGNWTVRFRILDNKGNIIHKRLSEWPEGSKNTFEKKLQAENAYYAFMSAYQKPQLSPVHQLTIQELFESYKKYQINEMKESSYVSYINRIELHVLPYFPDKTADTLTALDIADWKVKISSITRPNGKTFSYTYKQSLFEAFVHLINFGVTYWGIPKNIVSCVGGFKRGDTFKRKLQFWEPQDFDKFWATAEKDNSEESEKYRLYFLISYYSGCRKNELSAINWFDPDFTYSSINFDKTATRKTQNSGYKITSPKTENSVRVTHMPEKVIARLAAFKEVVKQAEDFQETDFVFGGKRVIPEQNVTNWFNKWIRQSGVKKIRVHDLRHSHVSFLLHVGGYDLSMLYVIADRIGDTPEMVLKTYGHMFPSRQKEILNAINTRIETLNI